MTGALIRKELLELHRTRKGLVLLAIFVVLGFTSPLLAKMMPDILEAMISSMPEGTFLEIPEPTVLDAYWQFQKNAYQLCMLTMMLLSMGCIVTEKNSNAIVLIATKPVSRAGWVLAKYVSYALALIVAFVLAFAGCATYTYLLFDDALLGRAVPAAVVMIVDNLFILAVVVLCSCVARSLVVCAFVVVGLHFVLLGVGAFFQRHDILLPGCNSPLTYFLIGGGKTPSEAVPAVVLTLSITAVVLAVAVWHFKRTEL